MPDEPIAWTLDYLKGMPVISREEAYRRYAEALKCAVAELTEAQKGTALMAEVMRQAGKPQQ